ncbi:TIGR01458 family HAD-type hydrolase [Pseudomaricurvus sp. HS19]|uniref:TIGR01458 family HAD-type hydrolase n=1 Tax=Pseudomaricurvus sp. HS19 TaxID=2692626 RepID=UPI001367D019|nr:TIGR01458 family HAD-type hydrolase [Pseudomaricurvus sp. HS19]MYM63431.1 TIGR01458 family HAD-type hydrolase [Pseudomaricurvus sp. HS19]
MNCLPNLHGLLIDIDGVLYVGDRAIDGAADTIQLLTDRGLPHRFVTNTTTRSREQMAAGLQAMGFNIQAAEILSTPAAAAAYLQQQHHHTCHCVVGDAIRPEFAGFDSDTETPDAIVIGDIGPNWSYALINRLARQVMEGAELIALHKGRFWQTEEGLQVDIGAFVAGIEYVTGVTATVIGKPSAAFFDTALQALQCGPQQVLMIGDDIESDVGGAQRCGMRGALVKTGKYRQAQAEASAVKPDLLLDSVADLPRYL